MLWGLACASVTYIVNPHEFYIGTKEEENFELEFYIGIKVSII